MFLARDVRLERDVAVKVLPPDDNARKRFRREARILAKLSHPNVAMAFDFGHRDGFDYLVTEYVSGITLDAKLERVPYRKRGCLSWVFSWLRDAGYSVGEISRGG